MSNGEHCEVGRRHWVIVGCDEAAHGMEYGGAAPNERRGPLTTSQLRYTKNSVFKHTPNTLSPNFTPKIQFNNLFVFSLKIRI